MATDTSTLARRRRREAPPVAAVGTPRKPAAKRPPTVDPAVDDTGWVLLAAIVAMLCTIGLMMVLSASSVEALRSYGGAWVFFTRQIMWVAIGSAVLAGAALVDYHRWRRVVPFLLGGSFVLLVLVLVPGVGITAGGSSRWLGTDSFRIQPSELAKLAVLLFGADLLARRVDLVSEWRSVMRPLLLTTGLIAGLVLVQPDMGTTLLMFFIVFVLMFVGGVRLLPMATLGVVGFVVSVILAKVEGYRWERVSSFRDPFGDFENTGYQVAQSLVALGTGNVSGVGLGASRAKWGFLPNAHTDFIFAILGEELGLIGTFGVVALFVAFAVVGIRIALQAPDRLGALLAAGVTAWVCGQAVVNMGAVTSLLPVTGVPLPFVSFGGSSLVVTMAATGILLNVARQARRAST
ncbi:MAG TPA: putative lipid II flippase FtsW [Acidimicrobiales bacterium]|nr:putative lipid II flippase FtsW [Acidimicrobiales bacterium]